MFGARCSPEDLAELECIACAIRDPLSNLCFPDPQPRLFGMQFQAELRQSIVERIRHDHHGESIFRRPTDVVQFSAGANRVTLWQAPKLGCEYLYDKAEAPARDGSFRIDLEVKTTKLVIGEPDAPLFEVAPIWWK